MLKIPTVFILGAGASMTFGFPSGYKLMCDIGDVCDQIIKGTYSRLAGIDLKPLQIKELHNAINNKAFFSIDALLGAFLDLNDVGKLLIASCLMPYEDPYTLFGLDYRQKNWIIHLFDLLKGDTVDDLCANEVTFVTFNYDRSLEFCLRHLIEDRYPFQSSGNMVERVMARLPIIHVHGQLGTLTEIPYKRDNQGLVTQKAAKGIKIIHEAEDNSAELVRAREAIQAAERIGILGFGYDKTNMKRLQLSGDWVRGKTIIGTCKGMSAMQCHDVELMLRAAAPMANKKNSTFFYRGEDNDCLWLLKNTKLGYPFNSERGSDETAIITP